MTTTAALLIYDDCALHSISRVTGLLMLANRANEEAGHPFAGIDLRIVSRGSEPTVTGNGVRVLAEHSLDSQRYDLVFVPGFYDHGPQRLEHVIASARGFSAWLRRQWGSGAMLAGFGSGALPLAQSGLLDGRKATTIQWARRTARSRFGDVRWQDSAPVTDSDRLLCSSSLSSDLPLLQRVISRSMSPAIASRCARMVLEHSGLSTDTPQFMTFLDDFHRDPVLAKIDQWLSRNLSRKPSLNRLSSALGVSTRTLHRLIRRELSVAPSRFLARRRFEAATRLLEHPQHSIAEVARRVGYSDASVFSRAFRQHTGMTPAAYRTRRLEAIARGV